jgi:hypothetical protein
LRLLSEVYTEDLTIEEASVDRLCMRNVGNCIAFANIGEPSCYTVHKRYVQTNVVGKLAASPEEREPDSLRLAQRVRGYRSRAKISRFAIGSRRKFAFAENGIHISSRSMTSN